jgi:hypothetical protein
MLILSLIWGILAIIGMVVAFFPCLGSLNWVNIPFSGIGLIISIISVVTTKEEKKGAGIAGIVLCAVAAVVGAIRLIAGGGLV